MAPGNKSSSPNGGVYDPVRWLADFQVAAHRKDHEKLRGLRRAIIHQTLGVIRQKGYDAPNGKRVRLPDTESDNVWLPCHSSSPTPRVPESPPPPVEVQDADCLQEALRLSAMGLRPVVMNMACPDHPGGGYLKGAGAQEENLFRRSDYCARISEDHYPLHSRILYTSNVHVFRDTEAGGYAFLPEAHPLSFIAIAAERNPPLRRVGGRMLLSDKTAAVLRAKLEAFCRLSAQQGHDALVLSALGCGAFRNPPDHVANIFADVLGQHGGSFKAIVIAILDDHNAGKAHNPRGNLAPFRDRFAAAGPVPPLPAAPFPDSDPDTSPQKNNHPPPQHAPSE